MEYRKLGRKIPYTEIGIGRKRCIRCKAKAEFQWQICALDNLYSPICRDCDISLNKLVLEFMGIANASKIITDYMLDK